MNELNAKPGLQVIGLYDQTHKLDQIQAVITKQKVSYPVTTDRAAFEAAGYVTNNLPTVWIVGVDGKFIFIGHKGYDEIVAKELAKVKYPGLGRSSVQKELEPAAKAFGEGKYAEAYKLAEAVDDEADDDKVLDDAEYIMERISDRLDALSKRAETAEVMQNYVLAVACWRELATHYKGLEDAEDAPKRLEKLTGDEKISKDIAARRALLALTLSLSVDGEKVDADKADQLAAFRQKCRDAYRKFEQDNKGNSAGDKAKVLADAYDKALADKPKPDPKSK